MNRRDRKKEKTRLHLLQIAMERFARHGIYATRVEDITEAADVAKGVFYNYFPSKNRLIAELLSQGVLLLEKSYLQKIDGRIRGKNRIREVLVQQESFWRDHPDYALLFHQSRGLLLLEGGSAELNHAFRDYIRCMARYLPSHPRSEESPKEEVLQQAVILAGLVSGYRSFAYAAGFPLDLDLVLQTATSGIPGTSAKNRLPTSSQTNKTQ